MLIHIVLWKLKASARGKTREENAVELKHRLEALKGLIPQIQELKVSFDFRKPAPSYEVCLDSMFKDEQALEKYQKHPDHQKVVAFVKEVTSDRAAIDYIVE